VTRVLQTELLDELPPADPRAARSRRDLQRLNTVMGNDATLAQALRSAWEQTSLRSLVELGAGDGVLLLKVLRRTRACWNATEVRHREGAFIGTYFNLSSDSGTAKVQNQAAVYSAPRGEPPLRALLLDRHDLVEQKTKDAFVRLNCEPVVIAADLFDWLPTAPESDAIIANLLLHHFSDEQLSGLFRAVAEQTKLFIALEPRRSLWSKLCSQCVGLIGCGRVTRHDAPVSVRAGFARNELSQLWPKSEDWHAEERPAGLFGHLFMAKRNAKNSKPRFSGSASLRSCGH
jgi:hypothetical protein